MAYKNKKDQADASRRHYDLNKEKVKARAKLNNIVALERNRNFIWDYLKNNPCIDCGETDSIVLEFDHRDTITKKFSIANAVRQKISIKSINKEIEKCDVRCANCHTRKTAVQFNYYKTK